MNHIAPAFNSVMQRSGGNLRTAAGLLAYEIEHDDQVKCDAAALIIALLLQPGFDEHNRIFKLDTGKSIEDWVQAYRPIPDEWNEEDDEAFAALLAAKHRRDATEG